MPAGYSGTPLFKKLGIKDGYTVYVKNPPANYEKLLAGMPDNVQFLESPTSKADLIHIFCRNYAEFADDLNKLRHSIKENGSIWVSWYKKASKIPTDITEDLIRNFALEIGLVDVKVCAVDEIWSGLKIVIRKENRIQETK